MKLQDPDLARDALRAYLTAIGNYERGPTQQTRSEIRLVEPTAKAIIDRLAPDGSLFFNSESQFGIADARAAAERALGLIDAEDMLMAILGPTGPSLDASQLHSWVWDGAASIWSEGNFRSAVQTAATLVQTHIKDKLGRQDLDGEDLMNQAFGEPKSAQPSVRLRYRPGSDDSIDKDIDRSLRDMGKALVAGSRNPASHTAAEYGQQDALEQLAAWSFFARRVEQTERVPAS